ncbi:MULTISPECIES: hypothetical protein [Psychrilyobacter]|uniref:Bacteriocin n=1 Tax=Psychrilyobacter piezotolerans TaxID=2293438 RepID=A0ABX9KDM0_9FUSO|nr:MULTISPECIES: hypothetical protein [Psychrilyobacter]MCS5422472.1 hypothetical protein [Psychrilyobacter sp. S5]NDI79014.1 hypothetical protein [Psychrilyobacter piezotolerans]RDE59097.1 hypothetical protein DV867_13800 [Psychrilyobacter sp. S5]REI39668.1 hypothetical protein DYH56_13800 [Psychrilyobacter piezotolerans]
MKELTREEMLEVNGGHWIDWVERGWETAHRAWEAHEVNKDRKERKERAKDRARERPSHEGAC